MGMILFSRRIASAEDMLLLFYSGGEWEANKRDPAQKTSARATLSIQPR
jgi:hypothetical protein